MAAVSKERRSKPRVPLDTEFVVFSGCERLWCRARDVAATGMALLSPLPGGNPGLYMRIQLTLPDGEAALPIDAVLVREQETPDGFVWGVRFHSLESWVASSIEIYVRKQLAEMVHSRKASANLSAARAKLQANAIKEKKARNQAAKKKPRKGKDGLLSSLFKKALDRQ
jgi:hypothetical protein